jgi:hypothetical protein
VKHPQFENSKYKMLQNQNVLCIDMMSQVENSKYKMLQNQNVLCIDMMSQVENSIPDLIVGCSQNTGALIILYEFCV